MPTTVDMPPSAVTPRASSSTDQPRTHPMHPMHPAARPVPPRRQADLAAPPRSALAEITLAHGQLEVVAARLALMVSRPDLGPNHLDILDAAHQARRALLCVHQARTHIEAAVGNHLTDDRSHSIEPSHWFG